ncbi:uncharacterized protein PgNI_09997 [Pyricularia grisea]|uniref:Chalcone synthase n=1 Tax=Pyricularia grisea TaxID=148305 RepID=A0A6P8ASY9_PYRGI|nr:uncharacterized protein PgNI_09997 [Pyricularia grisea]TLD05217.1 hypothetical protein PgNI_09997 [Pyricularia grisea]
MPPCANITNGTNWAPKASSTKVSSVPGLYITGLGSQFPPHLFGPEKLEELARRLYDVEKPALKKLLQINRSTGIETRASVGTFETTSFASRPDPPSIAELNDLFRDSAGVDLATRACRKALDEWGGDASTEITHTVAVTCTNQGNPGYDLLVAQRLGLGARVDRTLLSGVGCAGGLAVLRCAAQLAAGAAAGGRPARVLCFACEVCTPGMRRELAEVDACGDDVTGMSIAGALFADGAAAFVLCNELGMPEEQGDGTGKPLLQLLEWDNAVIPDSMQHLGSYVDPLGFRTILTRDVPGLTVKAVRPMLESLLRLPSLREQLGPSAEGLGAADLDWALHPGGQAIIAGVQASLVLTDDQLRATKQIYRTRGNSSSSAVLAVLDLLCGMGRGKDHVVAASFGPGIAIEMALFRRCR